MATEERRATTRSPADSEDEYTAASKLLLSQLASSGADEHAALLVQALYGFYSEFRDIRAMIRESIVSVYDASGMAVIMYQPHSDGVQVLVVNTYKLWFDWFNHMFSLSFHTRELILASRKRLHELIGPYSPPLRRFEPRWWKPGPHLRHLYNHNPAIRRMLDWEIAASLVEVARLARQADRMEREGDVKLAEMLRRSADTGRKLVMTLLNVMKRARLKTPVPDTIWRMDVYELEKVGRELMRKMEGGR